MAKKKCRMDLKGKCSETRGLGEYDNFKWSNGSIVNYLVNLLPLGIRYPLTALLDPYDLS